MHDDLAGSGEADIIRRICKYWRRKIFKRTSISNQANQYMLVSFKEYLNQQKYSQ